MGVTKVVTVVGVIISPSSRSTGYAIFRKICAVPPRRLPIQTAYRCSIESIVFSLNPEGHLGMQKLGKKPEKNDQHRASKGAHANQTA
jgi:hypothetical protein